MLLPRLRKALRMVGDPGKAPVMQAYMKSVLPYHGVPTPLLRRVLKDTFSDVVFPTRLDWERDVLGIWRQAQFREERYGAMWLTGDSRAADYQTPAALKLYEEMITTGAWWDYVDEIASNRVGPILQEYPVTMQRRMLAWSKSSDMWKRRTAILSQLRFKERTDLDFLYACIEPSLASREFFLRKAIGWALRQYAWTDPHAVKRYVRRHRDKLSPLSVREALKNVDRG
jgi:3-methyladenine DNA glycosylase AlkD